MRRTRDEDIYRLPSPLISLWGGKIMEMYKCKREKERLTDREEERGERK